MYNIIIHACHDYSARVCARDSLPNAEVQLTWARAAWDDACKEVEEEYQITDRILGLVSTLHLGNAEADKIIVADQNSWQ